MITIDVNRLSLPAGSRILDIGCGNGRHTAAAYGLPKAFVVGADPNQSDLAEAGNRLNFHHHVGAHGNGSWRLLSADATALPFSDRYFDLVICSEVLEHIPDHRKAMREIARTVRPGGQLAVSVPRRWPEALCWALSTPYRTTKGGHLRIYATAPLIDAIQNTGMRHWRTHYAHSLHSPYWWLKCLLGVDREDILPVRLYKRFLTWDIMTRPALTRTLDRLLNPICGKSIVLYFRKTHHTE